MLKLTLSTTLSDCTISYQDDTESSEITYELRSYQRALRPHQSSAPKSTSETVMGDVNRFLATLDLKEQKELFELYQQADSVMTKHEGDEHRIVRTVTSIASRMFKIINQVRFEENWCKGILRLKPHPSIADVHPSSTASASNRDRTYTKDEYLELAHMSIALRLMMPIWALYMFVTQAESIYKEYYAHRLLRNTWLWNCKAADRLLRYFGHCADEIKSSVTLSSNKLSTDNIPGYLAALVTVRRLVRVNLHDPEAPSIVSEIHNYGIKNKFGENGKELIKSFGGRAIERPTPNNSERESNVSVQELIRTQMTFSPGDKSLYRAYILKQNRNIAKHTHLWPMIRLHEDDYYRNYDACINYNTQLNWEGEHIEPLIMWTCGELIPQVMFESMTDAAVLPIVVSLAQAIYWTLGYEELAILVQARLNPNRTSDYSANRKQPEQGLRTKLAELYPMHNTLGGQDQEARRRQLKTNPGITAVDEMARIIPARSLDYNCCHELKTSYHDRLGISGSKAENFMVPNNIRSILARFCINVAECAKSTQETN